MAGRVLITGATGNVGGEVLKLFRGKSIPFRAALRNAEDAKTLGLTREEWTEFDFLKPATFRSTFEDIASMLLIRPPALSNVRRDIEPAIFAAVKAGVKHICFLSVIGADKNPFVPHHAVEASLRRGGVIHSFLRAGFFMQNLSTTHAPEIRDRSEIFVPAGRGKTGFVDARDVAAAATKILSEPSPSNQAFSLTGSEILNYPEVAEILSKELGRTITYRNPSALRFSLSMRKRGFGWNFIAVMVAIYTVNKLGRAATLTDDLERILGRKPILFCQFARHMRRVWPPGIFK